VLLKGLGAEKFVSSVTISGGKAEAKGCAVREVKEANGGVAFDRLDESLPFPIADSARAVMSISPEVAEMSQYTLAVKELKDGSYELKVGGVASGKFTAKQLADGINLTDLAPVPGAKDVNPIVAQMRAVLKAVEDKEVVVGQWRTLSKQAHAKGADAKLKDDLAAMTKKVEDADQKIRDAAKPKKLHFEVLPAK
jgi:hypothetical protein